MRRQPQTRSAGLFAVTACLLVLLALVSQLPPAAGPRGLFKGALAPLLGAATGVESALGAGSAVFGDIAGLRADSRRLEAQNQDLRRQIAELQVQGKENSDLRRELQFQRSFGHRTVAAQVVGRGADALSRALTVDRGQADGLATGMVVVTGAGLVGRVAEVGPHSALVQTIADPSVRVNAFTSRSGLEGTVGGGAGPLRMEVQPRPDVVVAPGEWALTSGIGGGYPRGIVIGQVLRFHRQDAATQELAELAWVNDLGRLSAVLVVTDFTAQPAGSSH